MGIRIEELSTLLGNLATWTTQLDHQAGTVRRAVTPVAIESSAVAALDSVADDLSALSKRLRGLLAEMRSIVWEGPSSLHDLSVVDPRDLSLEWAMKTIAKHFTQLDAAGSKGADGHISRADMAAALEGAPPELQHAIARVAFDPVAFNASDAGGDPGAEIDGTITRGELAGVREHGVAGVSLDEFSHAAGLVLGQMATLDTAAHGGTGDGRIAKSDLRAAIAAGSLDSNAEGAATFLLDHDELLQLLDEFAARGGNVLVRFGKGLVKLAVKVLPFTSPLAMAIALALDAKGTIEFGAHVGLGVVDGLVDTVEGLAGLAVVVGHIVVLSALGDEGAVMDELVKLGGNGLYAVQHWKQVLVGLADVDTLEKDPGLWLGRMGVKVAFRAGATSAITGGSLATRLALAANDSRAVASIQSLRSIGDARADAGARSRGTDTASFEKRLRQAEDQDLRTRVLQLTGPTPQPINQSKPINQPKPSNQSKQTNPTNSKEPQP